jgi:hypothetical protein
VSSSGWCSPDRCPWMESASAPSGLKSDIAPCPKGADIVAKVPKGAAANLPPKNETSDNRRSIALQTRFQNRLRVWRLATWSPTSLFNRCTYGSENLSPTSQKDFCNKIGQKRSFEAIACVPDDRDWNSRLRHCRHHCAERIPSRRQPSRTPYRLGAIGA